MKKFVVAATSLVLAAVVSLALIVPSAHAAAGKKVDCDKVMSELQSGKKPKEVAKDLSISTSSVYRCRKRAQAAAKSSPGATGSPAKAASPAASPAAH